jgi:hypothetical protein
MRRPWPTKGCCAMGKEEEKEYFKLNEMLNTDIILLSEK